MRYSVQAATRATGVSEHRLRTWERRYGVPSPGRSESGRRLYDEQDLAVIQRMARLIEAGIPASEAARAALTPDEPEDTHETPAAHPAVAQLLDATRAFDGAGLTALLDDSFAQLGRAEAIDQVVMPFLKVIGDAWESGDITLVYEHFTSELVRRVLLRHMGELPALPAGSPTVVLACPADERHDLGMICLWLLLLESGNSVIYLGADVPRADLVAACRELEPDAICLIATAVTALPTLNHSARAVIEARLPGRLFVGGPALEREDASRPVAGEHLPYTVSAAAERISHELAIRRG